MAGPALVYLACNWNDTEALRGWAIPTATDICLRARHIGTAGSAGTAFVEDISAGPGDHRLLRRNRHYCGVLHRGTVANRTDLGRRRCGCPRGAQFVWHVPSSNYMLVGMSIWVCVLKSGTPPSQVSSICGYLVLRGASSRRSTIIAHSRAPQRKAAGSSGRPI